MDEVANSSGENNGKNEEAERDAGFRVGRVIKVESELDRDIIDDAVDGAFLSPDRIADMVARFQQALEKQRQDQINRVWRVIHQIKPETAAGEWSFNPVTKTIVEIIPTENPE